MSPIAPIAMECLLPNGLLTTTMGLPIYPPHPRSLVLTPLKRHLLMSLGLAIVLPLALAIPLALLPPKALALALGLVQNPPQAKFLMNLPLNSLLSLNPMSLVSI